MVGIKSSYYLQQNNNYNFERTCYNNIMKWYQNTDHEILLFKNSISSWDHLLRMAGRLVNN
jgi:hypothetical protein